jgi:hypothetical protein
MPKMSFNEFPDETKGLIFSFMNPRSLTKLAITSKKNYYELWNSVGAYTNSNDNKDPHDNKEMNCEPMDNDFIVPVKQLKSQIKKKCKLCIRYSNPTDWCESCYIEFIEQQTQLADYYYNDDYLNEYYGHMQFVREYE